MHIIFHSTSFENPIFGTCRAGWNYHFQQPILQPNFTLVQSLCFAPCNVIYYFIATLFLIRFDLTIKRVESAIFNPTFNVSTSSTNTEKRIFRRSAKNNTMFHVVILRIGYRPSNREFFVNDLWHYLFQKTDCAIRREVGHRVIVSCFRQRNMIYKFVINI